MTWSLIHKLLPLYAPPVPLLLPLPLAAADPEPAATPPLSLPLLPAAVTNTAGDDWWLYVALGLALLLLLLLAFLGRRRAALAESSLNQTQTGVLEVPPSGPLEADQRDVDPVMELAEIMLSFGRLQGAAQTLREYIEANPREALQPWMKLLDIYREGDMRAEFEALAEKLHANFNVERQQWDGGAPLPPDTPIARAMSLEELPHLRERIVTTWGKQAGLNYLHQLLRDNRGGERRGFTLPVVQEILLLNDIQVRRMAAD